MVHLPIIQHDCATCDIFDHSLFRGCRAEDIALLGEGKTCTHYKKGETLYHEGQWPTALYCIYSGKIKVSKIGPSGREQIFRIAKAGDIIGYRSVFNGGKRTTYAAVLEDSEICSINKKAIDALVDSSPSFQKKVVQFLCTELEANEEKLLSLAQKTVRERIAEALIEFAETNGHAGTEKIEPTVYLSSKELAHIVGTAPETASRTLSDFKNEQLISVGQHSIIILNEKKLHGAAQLSS